LVRAVCVEAPPIDKAGIRRDYTNPLKFHAPRGVRPHEKVVEEDTLKRVIVIRRPEHFDSVGGILLDKFGAVARVPGVVAGNRELAFLTSFRHRAVRRRAADWVALLAGGIHEIDRHPPTGVCDLVIVKIVTPSVYLHSGADAQAVATRDTRAVGDRSSGALHARARGG
jgi:hypothetical protein